MLNYGYAVVRAAVARALVAAGLFPPIGLHHRSRADDFALADDLMEPFRPWVDARVQKYLLGRIPEELDQPAKAALLELLSTEVRSGEATGPLMVAMHRMCASLADAYRGEGKALLIPQPAMGPPGPVQPPGSPSPDDGT